MNRALFAAAALFPAAAASAYDNVQFVRSYEPAGAPSPAAVAVSSGVLYAADEDSGNIAKIGLEDGKALGELSVSGARFSALAAGPDGTIYAADPSSGRVYFFKAQAVPNNWFGEKGSEPGQLRSPSGLAVGADGRVYVADAKNGRVSIFGADGLFLDSFGEGTLSSPSKIAVDPADVVYVLDGGSRIVAFSPTGAGWRSKTIPLSASAFDVESHGWLYAADADEGKVRELRPTGAVEGAFGTKGKGAGQFKKPSDLVFRAGDVFVADPGNRRILRYRIDNAGRGAELEPNRQTKIGLTGPVWEAHGKIGPFVPLSDGLFGYDLDKRELVRLDEAGKVSLEFGSRGKGPGQVRDPKAIAFSTAQGVFVTDTGNDRIEFFSPEGKPTGVFGEKSGWFSSKSKEGNVSAPEGVAIGEKGTVYVADTGNARVQMFTKEGVFLSTIGPKLGAVQLSQPCGLQWDPKGRLYILDRGIKKVVEVEANGKFVRAWGQEGDGQGQWNEPVAFAYDGHGDLFVLDRKAARLKAFDTTGRWIADFFSRGQSAKSLAEPAALAFEGSRLFISDPGRSLVSAYDVRPVLAPPADVEASAAEGKAKLSWTATHEDWVASWHVERAAKPEGPFEALPAVTTPAITDAPDEVYATYYYRVSVEAKTGDVGPASPVQSVYVPGSYNAPPVQIGKIDLDYVFSANYKYYLSHPVGELTVENNQDETFKDVKLTFFLKDFMDFPSTIDVPELAPRSKTPVALKATLNNKILDVSEDTPILAEFKATYYENGKEQSFTRTKPIKVASRNAIIWDHTERMANFVTPNDDPVVDFRASALGADPKPKNGPRNANLNNALLIWSAAGALGVGYQPDPLHPYENIKGDESHPLDRVQFARETLRRKSGECKDLVALFASLFEAAGIPTALLDYPGHIAVAIDLNVSDPAEAGLSEDQLVRSGDKLWLPIETTMVGKPFTQAAEQAITTWKRSVKTKDARLIPLAEARKSYDPVSLPKAEEPAEAADKGKLQAAFQADADRLDKARYQLLKARYESALSKDGKDKTALLGYGILEAQAGRADEAKKRFEAVLAIDAGDASALNNLGNLAFQQGKLDEAEAAYQKAADADPGDPGVFLNLARAKMKKGDAAGAKTATEAAVKLDGSVEPMAKAILELK